MNKYPIGFEVIEGDLVQIYGVPKKVECGNRFDKFLGVWTSIKFVGEPDYFFTHKGGLEPYFRAVYNEHLTELTFNG